MNVSITLCYPLCVGFRVICFHRYSSFSLLGAGSRYSALILFTSRTCNDKRRKAKVLSLISMAAHAILYHAARPLRMSGMQEAPHNFQGRHTATCTAQDKQGDTSAPYHLSRRRPDAGAGSGQSRSDLRPMPQPHPRTHGPASSETKTEAEKDSGALVKSPRVKG